jgi:hypothetical protein
MALSFIVPDLELNTKLARALVILNNLSQNKAGNLVLTIEKIALCDFFLRHPYILHAVLRSQGKRTFDLYSDEFNSFSKEYPSISGLYTYKELKVTLQILLLHGYATASLNNENDAVYSITSSGSDFINSLSTAYILRLNEIAKPTSQLLSLNYRQLMAAIKPYINGK